VRFTSRRAKWANSHPKWLKGLAYAVAFVIASLNASLLGGRQGLAELC